MLYIIGLGLNVDGISSFGLAAAQRCKKVYLENYTVDLPYTEIQLIDVLKGKKVIPADREFVESLQIIDEAKNKDVALLVYGSPLTATTHITLIQEAKALLCKVKPWLFKFEKATKDKIIDTTILVDLRETKLEGDELHLYMSMGTELGTGIRNNIT